MSSTNNILKEVLLIGTDRKPIPWDSLPESLRQKTQADQSDANHLLQVITYLTRYDNYNTTLPIQSNINLPEIITDEAEHEVNPQALSILGEILSQEYLLKNQLLTEWIDIVAQSDQTVPYEKILKLLDHAMNLNMATREKLLSIIGNKGRYVAQLMHADKYGGHKELDISQWDIANLDDRKKLLAQINKEKPVQANQLLQSAWPQSSIREKLSLLQVLSDNLQEENNIWLEEILEQEYKERHIKQSTARQCKLLIIAMLLRLNDPYLQNLIRSNLQAYLTKTQSAGLMKRMVGIKSTGINLPNDADTFWNGESMNSLFGIADKNNNIKLFDYDPQFWFAELIKITPWKLLCEIFESKSDDLVKYLIKDKSFITKIANEETPILIDAIVSNAHATKNSELISSIASLIDHPKCHELCALMNQSEFEKYVSRHKLFTQIDILASRAPSLEHNWSVHFSKNMISELLKICKSGKFRPHPKFGHTTARYFHPKAIDHLMSAASNFQNEHWYSTWKNNLVDPIIIGMRLKDALNQMKENI